MNGENRHENSQFQKLFLVVLASLIAACAAPESKWDKEREVHDLLEKKAEKANQFFKDKILGFIVETELTYRLFMVKRNVDEFKGKLPAILDGPAINFIAKPNEEQDGGVYDFGGLSYHLTGDRFFAWENSVHTHNARLSQEKFRKLDSKGLVDGVLKTSISDEIIYYKFSYLSNWNRNFGGLSLSNKAYFTVVENAQDITFLYVGSPLVMAHLSSVTEVRDINRIKYEVVKTFAPDYFPVHQIAIPTGKLLRYASGGEPLVLKLYGEMEGRENLVYYIVKIPNWYLRAYIYASLKHGLISKELAGRKIVSEFEKLQKLPDPIFPVFHIEAKKETVNDANGGK